mgnify:CR=1 FL=1
MSSKWESYGIESKIIEVLSDTKYDSGHHFGRPFLTPYQIAIELVNRHPTICVDLDKEFGGQGTNKETSLVQYIARELSARIKSGRITNIEGAHLSNDHLSQYSFRGADGSEVSTSNRGQEHLSMFRLSDK